MDTMRYKMERKNRELMAKDRVIDEMRMRIEHVRHSTALFPDLPVSQLEQALMVNSIRLSTTVVQTNTGKATRHVLVRTTAQKEGGIKVPVPTTNAELVALGSHELRINGAGVRALSLMKVNVSDLNEGDVIYITTEADEKKFSILGL